MEKKELKKMAIVLQELGLSYSETMEVMKEIGIDLSDQYSKNIKEFKNEKFDYVITVCNNAREKCQFFPGEKIIHKGFNDPANTDGSIEEILISFKKIRDEIKDWIVKYF